MERANLVRAGRWDIAALGPVTTEPGDRREIARRALSLFSDCPIRRPFSFCRALGVEPMIAPINGCGGELTTGTLILLRWHESHAVRVERVLHGIAHVLFRRENWHHTEADVWLLTDDLLREAGKSDL